MRNFLQHRTGVSSFTNKYRNPFILKYHAILTKQERLQAKLDTKNTSPIIKNNNKTEQISYGINDHSVSENTVSPPNLDTNSLIFS